MNKRLFGILVDIEKRRGALFGLAIWVNDLLIRMFERRFPWTGQRGFSAKGAQYSLRRLSSGDLPALVDFFARGMNADDPSFFMPHAVDEKALVKVLCRRSHIPLGIYSGSQLVGYALIRLLFPKTGSYAIFVADRWQGRGIGTAALIEELKIIRELGYVPSSAVSKANKKSIRMLDKAGMELATDLGDYFEVKGGPRAG